MLRDRAAFILVAVAMGLALAAADAHAYFERIYLSSRAYALGGAFVALADDASATVINPAGLTQVPSYNLLATAASPYNVSDLEEYYFAASIPTRIGAFGVSWHRFGMENVTAEDLISVAYGRDLIRTTQDASLSVGASVDISRISYTDVYDSRTVASGSLSLLLRPFPVIGFGYNIRNLGQPSIEFVAGGGSTVLRTTQTFGFSFFLQQNLVVLYDRELGQDREWRERFGIEFRPRNSLVFRGGLNGGDVTAGVGLKVSTVSVDAAMSAHDALGYTYILSLGFWFGGQEDNQW